MMSDLGILGALHADWILGSWGHCTRIVGGNRQPPVDAVCRISGALHVDRGNRKLLWDAVTP